MARMTVPCTACGGKGTVKRQETEERRKWLNDAFPAICNPCGGTGAVSADIKVEETKPAAVAPDYNYCDG